MPVYTVHAPQSYGADLRATDKFTFVRDGFHLWAMIFGPFWLIWNRLWIATLGWIVVIAVGIGGRRVDGSPGDAHPNCTKHTTRKLSASAQRPRIPRRIARFATRTFAMF